MFSCSNTSAKALCEAILYYYRERENLNTALKFIIITDFYQFYIFKAKEFEKLFYTNKKIKSILKSEVFSNNTNLYKEIQKCLLSDNFSESITGKKDLFDIYLNGLYIDLRNKNQKLTPNLHKIFHRDFLHAEFKPDANRINQRFFDELLYILGLKQDKQQIVQDTDRYSFFAMILEKLPENKNDFETALNLTILWLNRILFLKLIETQLISFTNDKNIKFLNKKIITDFNRLNDLFFSVFGKSYNERTKEEDLSQFHYLPYLNSSLFAENDKEIIKINKLNDIEIDIYKHTQLKDDRNKQKEGKTRFLEYLFDFLDAFDYSKLENTIQDSEMLMDSRILGLVFEKLNGYKEGSFYTPSFITSYMCKESLEKVVLQKFNSAKEWDCKDLESLRLKLDKLTDSTHGYKKANEIFDSIRVCDPAVGSGHFLVSMLNATIELKFRLGILCDESFNRIKDIAISIEHDEIIIKEQGKIHNYKRPQHENESHKIQKAIFYNKRKIMESCLFGVDINPNSCQIARLRLWIELLKHTYYIDLQDTKIHKLQTLTNIDINIKCGNSLISYFDITQSLNHYPNIKQKMEDYKKSVSNYKQGFYTSKADIDKDIKNLKEAFKKFCLKDKFKKEIKAFEKECDIYSQKYGNYIAKDDKDLSIYVKAGFFLEFDDKEAQIDFAKLQDKYNSIFNLESNKPFEWRFEFPEVLDSNGDFLGFDLIIGNPPYIRQEDIKELKPLLSKAYKVYKGTSDIYTYFFELGYKVLKDSGILSFITSNKYTRVGYGESLREFILANTTILNYIELNGIKVFDSASVDTSIITFQKDKAKVNTTFYYLAPKEMKEISLYESNSQKLKQSSLTREGFHFSDEATQNLKAKIEKIGTPLKDWDISINYGVKTGYNEAFIIDSPTREKILSNCKTPQEKEATNALIKKVLRGRDIKRYSYEWEGLWLINTHNGYTSKKTSTKIPPIDINQYPTLKAYFDNIAQTHKGKGKGLFERDDKGNTPYNLRNCAYLEEFEGGKIVYSEIVRQPQFFLDSNEKLYAEAISFIMTGQNLKYLIGFLNSQSVAYIFKTFYAGGGLGVEGYRYKKAFLENLPIPQITQENQKTAEQIIGCVEQILKAKEANPQSDTQDLESKIDNLVYKLYSLTNDEIKIIERNKCNIMNN